MSDTAPAVTEDITYNSNIPSYAWFLGSTNVGKMYLGDQLVTAAYLGTQKVWEAQSCQEWDSRKQRVKKEIGLQK